MNWISNVFFKDIQNQQTVPESRQENQICGVLPSALNVSDPLYGKHKCSLVNRYGNDDYLLARYQEGKTFQDIQQDFNTSSMRFLYPIFHLVLKPSLYVLPFGSSSSYPTYLRHDVVIHLLWMILFSHHLYSLVAYCILSWALKHNLLNFMHFKYQYGRRFCFCVCFYKE